MSNWPALRSTDWAQTRDTLQLWCQIVGKIKLTKTPMVNHWWNVTYAVSSRGLTTGAIEDAGRLFEIEFDLVDQELRITVSDGSERRVALRPQPIAAFYEEVMGAMDALGFSADIYAVPVELPAVVPFAEDTGARVYEGDQAKAFWQQLVVINPLFKRFRSHYTGKSSEIHFFWGFFDLTVSLYSGRNAPLFPGHVPNCPDYVLTESYSREELAVGFSSDGGEEGAFYAYAYAEPDGFSVGDLGVPGAAYNPEIGRWLLPWETVRETDDPEGLVMAFLDASLRREVDLADWDRSLVGGPLTTSS